MRQGTIHAAAAFCLITGLALPAAAQQQDFSKVEIKATKVAGNIYMLEGSGGNIGVSVGSDGILIVDDQFAPLADKIHAALKGLSDGKLKFVLNTHWHGDHTGGNQAFGAEAPIIAHENVRKRLSSEQKIMGETIPASPQGALPVITFGDRVSVHFNGEEIKVIHFPAGHTDGDSVIFFTGSNVVHMGDDFFTGRFPFIDLASGGSVQGLTENVGKILAQLPADVKIIPGHGPLSDKADLEKFHRMLVDTTAIVEKKMRAGKTMQAIQDEGLPDEFKEWGNGFTKTKTWLAVV
ncbi:MAG TPA: MBL fold metallo-hydrolase, partial [Thermoanaerobaculia bacterium]|nr:MBL fold metallo-hydrolase [Thermoanaerobaculia bacterium]